MRVGYLPQGAGEGEGSGFAGTSVDRCGCSGLEGPSVVWVLG